MSFYEEEELVVVVLVLMMMIMLLSAGAEPSEAITHNSMIGDVNIYWMYWRLYIQSDRPCKGDFTYGRSGRNLQEVRLMRGS